MYFMNVCILIHADNCVFSYPQIVLHAFAPSILPQAQAHIHVDTIIHTIECLFDE